MRRASCELQRRRSLEGSRWPRSGPGGAVHGAPAAINAATCLMITGTSRNTQRGGCDPPRKFRSGTRANNGNRTSSCNEWREAPTTARPFTQSCKGAAPVRLGTTRCHRYREHRCPVLNDTIVPDFAFYLSLVTSARSVLDVGCGTGELLRLAREAGHRGDLCGLDPADPMLEHGRVLGPSTLQLTTR